MALRRLLIILQLSPVNLHVLGLFASVHDFLAIVERISSAPERGGKVAARFATFVEMQMEHLVARREHPTVLPIEADLLVLPALVPEDREPLAFDAIHMEIRAVAVGSFIGPDGHLRDMRVHGAVGHDQHDVRAAAAAFIPRLKLQLLEVGNEVGLPGMKPGGT